MEIVYELYNPTITKIEVLKLERRLDDNLAYLRDAPPEYCTFPFDMEPVKLPPGSGVPLNTIQVISSSSLMTIFHPIISGSHYQHTLAIQMGTS